MYDLEKDIKVEVKVRSICILIFKVTQRTKFQSLGGQMKNKNRTFFKALPQFFIGLLAFGGMLLCEASGQVVGEKDVQKMLTEISTNTKLIQLSESRERTVERKLSLVEKLKKRLDSTLSEAGSEVKKGRVSLFAYELFLAEARLAAENLKLWQIEVVMS